MYIFTIGEICMKKAIKSVIALTVTILLVLSFVPSSLVHTLAAGNSAITIGLLTDVHYYPRSMMGDDINEFIEACSLNSSTSYLTPALLDMALEEYENTAAETGMKYLFIPGDLARNGEYEAECALAKKLEAFEQRTGIQVLVIDGNHDIRKANSSRFQNGEYVYARWTEPEDFREIYKNLGYDLADSFYTPPAGKEAGQLSYAATLDGGYRLIAIDAACYSADIHSKGLDEGETRGEIAPDLMKWVLNEIKKANEQGLTVIGMTHFNVVEHYDHEDNTMQAFVLENWQEVCEQLADAGMHFTFTGHLHFHDIAQWVSDNGETMTDCATASMQVFPDYKRIITLDNTAADGSVKLEYKTVECDNAKPVTAFGTTYSTPFKYEAFALNYGGGDIVDFGTRYVEYFLTKSIGPDIKKAGGLYNYLDSKFDIANLVFGLLKNANLGAAEGITKSAVKALLKTVCAQLQAKYIDNPENALNLVRKILTKFASVEISDYPCTKYIDTLGFGDSNRKGNVGDIISTCLAYMYLGDEDRSDDPFTNNVLDRFYRGENAREIFDCLYDIVLHDVLEDELLPTIQVDPVRILGSMSEDLDVDILKSVLSTVFDTAGSVSDNLPKISAGNIAAIIFALGVTDYKSVEDVINSFLDDYVNDSFFEVLAYEFYNFIYDFTTDRGTPDLNTTIVYNGKVPVEATVENLRLPSGVSVTFGDNSLTERNINWFTKVGVTGTDIEIVPYENGASFTGTPTTSGVQAQTERTTRQYPGIDLGVFGILNYKFFVSHHTVKLTGLESGKKYYYRVGDASRGWWSQSGIIETADNSDSLTFIHTTDSQGGIERQYEKNANALKTAYGMFPDADFLLSSGDQVDKGTNFKQWNWLFNTGSDTYMNTTFAPTAGNHEKSDYSLTDYMLLGNLPNQSTETGVYYSYDYNNAHIIVLNSNDLNSDGTLSGNQLSWLKSDAAASNADWKIVSIHNAVYSNGPHFDDDESAALRNQLATLMPQLGIDLVFEGHDHVYWRTDVMNNNEIVKTQTANVSFNGNEYKAKVKPQGTIYALDGDSGVKYYDTKDTGDSFPAAEKSGKISSPTFTAVQIRGDRLYYDTYSVDESGNATRVDSFAIAKSLTTEEAKANNITDASVIDDNAAGGTANQDAASPSGTSTSTTSSATGSSSKSPKTGNDAFNYLLYASPAVAAAVIIGLFIYKKREDEFYAKYF